MPTVHARTAAPDAQFPEACPLFPPPPPGLEGRPGRVTADRGALLATRNDQIRELGIRELGPKRILNSEGWREFLGP